MICHVNAVPGNGKSAFLMYKLEEVFATTDNNIVTWSLPLKEFQVVKVLAAKYPERAHEIADRFTELTFEEGFTWWRYRGANREGNQVVWTPTKEFVPAADGTMHEKITWPRTTKADRRVTYFLDEWGEAYNITQSGAFTPEHKNALRQHRKLSADAWIANPVFSELAKPYRDVGQYFYEVKNLGYEEKGYGKAKVVLSTHFMYSAYLVPPTGERSKPSFSGNFFLRAGEDGIHSCYNTAGGVGVNNAMADMGQEKQGFKLTLKRVAVIAAILLAGLGGLGWVGWKKFSGGNLFSGQTLQKTMAGKAGDSKTAQTGQPDKLTVAPAVIQPALPPRQAQQQVHYMPPTVKPAEVTIDWVARVGGELTFGLSDGTTLDNPAGAWNGRTLGLMDGRRFQYKPKKPVKAVKNDTN